MFPENKLDRIRVYIKTRFPNCELTDQYHAKRIAQSFRLTCKDRIILVIVSRSFIDDRTPADILVTLLGYRLDQYIRDRKISHIKLTKVGIDLEFNAD